MSFSKEEITKEEVSTALELLRTRCKLAEIEIEDAETEAGNKFLRVKMRAAREFRSVEIHNGPELQAFISIPFEKYCFLNGLEAICSYEEGVIEAAIRPSVSPNSFLPARLVYERLFNTREENGSFSLRAIKVELKSEHENYPQFELSPASDVFNSLFPGRSFRLTLKLMGGKVSTHDKAVELLHKAANAIFFQIDAVSDVSFMLEREPRRRENGIKKERKRVDLAAELQYPRSEYDDAPLSLYWYARRAAGMPLLQFLALYQVVEFYFPIYSQAEAQRKLRAILKDPTFRGDRDSDIGKLLSAIHVTRSGAVGDERSQLRATISACVDPAALRDFFEGDAGRREFYLAKAKPHGYHKIPVGTADADLRNDVSDRIYDIRCRIVHTKNDFRDNGGELLLPFSKEAEQLAFDIELARYIAKAVLIAASSPFNGHA